MHSVKIMTRSPEFDLSTLILVAMLTPGGFLNVRSHRRTETHDCLHVKWPLFYISLTEVGKCIQILIKLRNI